MNFAILMPLQVLMLDIKFGWNWWQRFLRSRKCELWFFLEITFSQALTLGLSQGSEDGNIMALIFCVFKILSTSSFMLALSRSWIPLPVSQSDLSLDTETVLAD